jgi:hypothetical protein
MIYVINALLILAFLFFVAAALGLTLAPFNFVAVGLAFWIASQLVPLLIPVTLKKEI